LLQSRMMSMLPVWICCEVSTISNELLCKIYHSIPGIRLYRLLVLIKHSVTILFICFPFTVSCYSVRDGYWKNRRGCLHTSRNAFAGSILCYCHINKYNNIFIY
jgi:hypothetical protein